jgi:flagellar biogenesis protein FliO
MRKVDQTGKGQVMSARAAVLAFALLTAGNGLAIILVLAWFLSRINNRRSY